jgi:hypothetical protein
LNDVLFIKFKKLRRFSIYLKIAIYSLYYLVGVNKMLKTLDLKFKKGNALWIGLFIVIVTITLISIII